MSAEFIEVNYTTHAGRIWDGSSFIEQAEPRHFDITQVSLRVAGACKNHPGWYVHRCQKCRRDARTLHDRAAQKHIDVATQAVTEAKAALCRKRDVVLAEHKLRLAVLAAQQWGEPEEET